MNDFIKWGNFTQSTKHTFKMSSYKPSRWCDICLLGFFVSKLALMPFKL